MNRYISKLRSYRLIVQCALQRRLTAGTLPDFLIIGVQKGGTTSLWDTLKTHPAIEFAPKFAEFDALGKFNRKEIHFFDKPQRWTRGPAWYAGFFNSNGRRQGEATPAYIYSFDAHARMAQTVPRARLILLLRDPVMRAYSAFNHNLRMKCGTLSFDERMTKLSRLIDGEMAGDHKAGDLIHRGFYMDQLEHLLRYFPREQVLVLIAEQMWREPAAMLDRICAFLGVPPYPFKLANINPGRYADAMAPAIAARLRHVYRGHNERLYTFLDAPVAEWEL